jgi:hypothetical protein
MFSLFVPIHKVVDAQEDKMCDVCLCSECHIPYNLGTCTMKAICIENTHIMCEFCTIECKNYTPKNK